MDFLQFWADLVDLVAVPLAMIAIVFSVALAVWAIQRGRRKMGLACSFESVESPIEIKSGKGLDGDIEIQVGGRRVENLFAIRARLFNSGNVPIRGRQVHEPVTFRFGNDAQILREPTTLERNPANLRAEVQLHDGGDDNVFRTASLDFPLLNPEEGLVLEFTCTGEVQIPDVTARIEGVSEIDRKKPEGSLGRLRRRVRWAGWIYLAIAAVCAALVLLDPSFSSWFVVAIMVLLGYAFVRISARMTNDDRVPWRAE